MVEVRHPEHASDDPGTGGGGFGGRLNLLLTHAQWRDESWVDCLPRLLEPMGVHAWRAQSGAEATDLIRRVPVHIAVVDLSLPLQASDASSGAPEEAGPRILDLLARLEQPPPVVVVKRRRTRREDDRQLSSALRAGAFAVLESPVRLETALEVMRRVLARHYADRWPGADTTNHERGHGRPR